MKASQLTFEQSYKDEVQLVSTDTRVLSSGAWATVLFTVVDGAGDPAGYVLGRYRKKDGVYKLQSKFRMTSTLAENLAALFVADFYETLEEGGAV